MDLIGEELIKLYTTAQFLTSYSNKVQNIDLRDFISSRLGFKSSNNKKLTPTNLIYAFKSKPEDIKNEFILRALRNFSFRLNFDNLKSYTKISLGFIHFTSFHNTTKRCDSCFISINTKKIGLIEKFVYDSENCLVVAKQLIEIYNPFFSTACNELKSKSTICILSENYFVEELKYLKKIFFTDILGQDNILISNFSVSHLFN